MVVEQDLCVPSLFSVLFLGVRFSAAVWYSSSNLSSSQIKVEDKWELKCLFELVLALVLQVVD